LTFFTTLVRSPRTLSDDGGLKKMHTEDGHLDWEEWAEARREAARAADGQAYLVVTDADGSSGIIVLAAGEADHLLVRARAVFDSADAQAAVPLPRRQLAALDYLRAVAVGDPAVMATPDTSACVALWVSSQCQTDAELSQMLAELRRPGTALLVTLRPTVDGFTPINFDFDRLWPVHSTLH
jgi:hypothetical protein